MENLPVIDKESAVDRLDGDEGLWRELVPLLLSDAPTYIKALAYALRNEDAEDASAQAHTLKSAVANIGAEETRELAMKIEYACNDKDIPTAKQLFPQLKMAYDQVIDYAKINGLSE